MVIKMRLNNKGWGLTTMIICVATILIFLIIAAIFSMRLNKMMEETIINNENSNVDVKRYMDEKLADMIVASNNYLKESDIPLEYGSYVKIELETLIQLNYINPIKDPISNRECKGYVVASENIDHIKDIKSYIKCDNYKSGGYDE